MAQKLLTPFKKLPQQLQNLPIYKKLQDLTTGKQGGTLTCHGASAYGIMEQPVALAYDQDLCFLGVAYKHGHIEIYGMPGLSFPVDCLVKDIRFMEFIRNEGRLLLATSDSLVIVELNIATGHWERKHSVHLPFASEESITAFTIGKGVAYVGSSTGTLRQVALENGNMTVGDDDLTSLPPLLVLNKVPDDKRESLKLETPIVSIELHPNGEDLLLGYAGGTAVVAQPQPIPESASCAVVVANPEGGVATSPPEGITEEPAPPPAEEAPQEKTDVVDSATPQESSEKSPQLEQGNLAKKSKTGERNVTANLQSIRVQATKKFRTLSKTIKNKIEHSLTEGEKHECLHLPVAPSPKVVRLLPYSQALCCATWRISSLANCPLEVLVAYDDGAYLTWNIPKVESEAEEPVVANNQDVASVPYGPLPCAAIQRIIARPSVNGGVITAFVGGLPRAEHAEKHTISVLGGVEEHVCFQFGSAVRDFVVLPSKPQQTECPCGENSECETNKPEIDGEEAKTEKHPAAPATPTDAGYLVVLTERELVAIDLTQPTWPVLPAPYLRHMDCAGITAVAHLAVPEKVMTRLRQAAGATGFDNWPVIGGKRGGDESFCCGVVQQATSAAAADCHDLVAIAHAHADVSLWHVVRGDCLEALGRVSSLAMMADATVVGCHAERKNEESAWPPFRKVGDCVCSPATAEGTPNPRTAIHSLSLQLVGEEEVLLLIGGGAGNLSVWSTAPEKKAFEPDTGRIVVDLLDGEGALFTWEGHEAFKPMEGVFTPCPSSTPGFSLCELVQLNPPSAVTAVALEPRWEALAIGSTHGFALIDLRLRRVVHKRLTHDLQVAPESGLPSAARDAATKIAASGRHLKAHLRESFRKIRKMRTFGSTTATDGSSHDSKKTDSAKADDEVRAVASNVVNETIANATAAEEKALETEKKVEEEVVEEEKPVEEPALETTKAAEPEVPAPQVLKPTDSCCGVSALALVDTHVVAGVPTRSAAALLVGTRSSDLLVHSLAWPKALEAPLEARFVRAIKFKHGAPILAIHLVDTEAHCAPVVTEKSRSVPEVMPEPVEVAEGGGEPPEGTATSTISHELVVCTEEQVREIALPSLKTRHKYHFWEKNPPLSLPASLKPSSLLQHMSGSKHPKTETAAPAEENAGEVKSSETPVTAEPAEAEAGALVAPVATPEGDTPNETPEKSLEEACPVSPGSAPPVSRVSLRRVVSFGLQRFPHTSAQYSEWHAVVASKDGRLHVLCLPGLKRVLKAACCEHGECGGVKALQCSGGLSTACVSNSSNLVFWPLTGCLLLASELTFGTPGRLISPVHVCGLKDASEAASYCVCLPEWARPKSPPASSTTTAAPSGVAAADAANASLPSTNEKQTDESGDRTSEETAGKGEELTVTICDAAESADTAKKVNECTKDMTKGLLNDESGIVTVKTSESSLEKRTVIEGGNVMTTVHETERVDGEVVKDDIVQVKSNVEDSNAKPEVTA